MKKVLSSRAFTAIYIAVFLIAAIVVINPQDASAKSKNIMKAKITNHYGTKKVVKKGQSSRKAYKKIAENEQSRGVTNSLFGIAMAIIGTLMLRDKKKKRIFSTPF